MRWQVMNEIPPVDDYAATIFHLATRAAICMFNFALNFGEDYFLRYHALMTMRSIRLLDMISLLTPV